MPEDPKLYKKKKLKKKRQNDIDHVKNRKCIVIQSTEVRYDIDPIYKKNFTASKNILKNSKSFKFC